MFERYVRFAPPEALALLFATVNAVPAAAPSWNIAPGRSALVVRRDPASGERHLVSLRFGIDAPGWMKQPPPQPLFEARAENVATSALFRAGFAVRRCLVPADAFYLWTKASPGPACEAAVARRNGQPMAFAGLWEMPRQRDGTLHFSFAIITTSANAPLRRFGNRMPAILEQADWAVWLDEAPGDIMALLSPAAPARLCFWSVGSEVRDRRADGPRLLAPCAQRTALSGESAKR